jgi:predicted pyridoxine 5'-phosphate oxidase superfamily flavin-nucleotide-binding protein
MTARIVSDTSTSAPITRERIDAHAVRTIEALYAINGEPSEAIRTKHTSYLTPLLVEYLGQVPFFALATANADGSCDGTPRGDAPGAIKVIDERAIAIPERPGTAGSILCATSSRTRTWGCSS